MALERTAARAGTRSFRVVARLLTVLGLWGLFAPGISASAQESAPEAGQLPQTFRSRSGVRIEITPERPASDADVLAALEDAGRQVRQRLQAAPAAVPVSEPVSSPGPPASGSAAAEPAHVPSEPHTASADPATPLPWRQDAHLVVLPGSLLWQPPMANQHEPQIYGRVTSLHNQNTSKTIDAAFGGVAPLLRLTDDPCGGTGLQLDFFGVVFPRLADFETQLDSDFRFGCPLTWASGPWEAMLGYEHTSSHLADDFIRRHPGTFKRGHVRDEIVTGLSYRWWNQLRLYAQVGYAALYFNTPGPRRADRYDVGLEWSRQVATGLRGQPFAAIDMDLRGDEDYTPNLSVQLGWQWLQPGQLGSSLRLALELYDGRSPFGQFFMQREEWVGVGLHFDF
jgi:hypothetical protein